MRVVGGIASRNLSLWAADILPRMVPVHEHRRVVVADDIDELGHVNNLRYLAWILEAAREHSIAVGWPAARYAELGCAWVVRSHTIEYLRPAFVGDAICVRTWVTEMGKVSSRRSAQVLRDDVVLARAETLWVFVRGQALERVPADLRAAFPVQPAQPPDHEPGVI